MRKRMLVFLLLALIICGLTGCKCEHQWQSADCYNPKICIHCGAKEGTKLDHVWLDPTCTAPKTCSACGETEGESLRHTFLPATCTESVRCSLCGMTMGNPKGHVEGEWEVLEENRIEGMQEERLVCLVCNEELERKKSPMMALHDGTVFILTPEEFARRLGGILASQEGNTRYVLEGEDEKRYSTTIASDTGNWGSIRYRSGRVFIGLEEKDIFCFDGILCDANGNENIMQIVTAVIQTCDPGISHEDAEELVAHLLESGKRTINGITYSYSFMGGSGLLSAVVSG